MITEALEVALFLAIVVLGTISAKYYSVVKAAEKKLPADATTQQKIMAGLQAVVTYAKANPTQDKQALQALSSLLTSIGGLTGYNVASLVTEVGALIAAIP